MSNEINRAEPGHYDPPPHAVRANELGEKIALQHAELESWKFAASRQTLRISALEAEIARLQDAMTCRAAPKGHIITDDGSILKIESRQWRQDGNTCLHTYTARTTI